MCIWKAWKKVKTKVANLIRCGINKYKAYEWGNTCKGYWRIADSPILKRAIDNNKLRSAGYATLMETYLEWYPKGSYNIVVFLTICISYANNCFTL